MPDTPALARRSVEQGGRAREVRPLKTLFLSALMGLSHKGHVEPVSPFRTREPGPLPLSAELTLQWAGALGSAQEMAFQKRWWISILQKWRVFLQPPD